MMVLQTKMMVIQVPDHHLGFRQNALCRNQLLKRVEQDAGASDFACGGRAAW